MDKTIALYMRLSDEDDNLAAHEESNSISHQRKLMLDHIQKLPELKDCNIMEFSDDGYSGADFSRPNFVKMMDLVKAGKIQVIVTKDYSRLGRDYLEVGNYMECIFPVLQVRYISVNDNYDSANSFGSTGGMSVALKNLVNALYCKDASKKVRAAKAVLVCVRVLQRMNQEHQENIILEIQAVSQTGQHMASSVGNLLWKVYQRFWNIFQAIRRHLIRWQNQVLYSIFC